MGINFTYAKKKEGAADAAWSYSGFNRFREKVAKSIGVDLYTMTGFTKMAIGGDWSLVKSPLKYLLNHSDCDGTLTPRQCAVIAPELKKVILSWNDIPTDNEYDKAQGLELVEMMKKCEKLNTPLIFT